MRTAILVATLVAGTGLSAQQSSTIPPNAAAYEVRLSFEGHLGSLASAPDCPVRRNGKAVMSGIVSGVETVPADDDLTYVGVLRLDVDIDLCEVTRVGGEDTLCKITVVGGGPMNVELDVYADDRGGYVKATRAKGAFAAKTEGTCGNQANDEELKAFPNNSMANPFNGTELALPSGPLRVGRYANEEAILEVLKIVRRP
jgi:hypothetical protein